MHVPVISHPLEWYVDKLIRHEPFVSILYGDGEFMAADGEHIGQTLAFGEVVTEQLCKEMVASLLEPGSDIVRGTDPNLVNHLDYGGSDLDSFRKVGERIDRLLAKYNLNLHWVDGVMWDVASREGKLGPILRILRYRQTIVAANPALKTFVEDNLRSTFVAIPTENAVASIDQIESSLIQRADRSMFPVFVLCVGLSAIPLAMRLRKAVPNCTVIDLGSVLDVFAGIGEQRGWRREMYADKEAWQACIAKNLEGM